MNKKAYSVITLEVHGGRRLDAFAGDSITREIEEKGEYDKNTLNSLRTILNEIHPRISLDIGANIGNHALVIAEYSERLFAFEPVPFIFEVLSRNLKQNRAFNAVAINAGLSDEAISRDIFIPDYGNLGCSSLESIDAEGSQVAIKTLIGDQFLEHENAAFEVDFIKIDVEGHEPAALLGLEKTLSQQRPLLLMEYRNQNTLNLFHDLTLFNRLFPGYRIYSLSNTANKKVYASGLFGFLRRMRAKLCGSHWCLSDFDPKKRYSNIYLVPERFQPLFERFHYQASK